MKLASFILKDTRTWGVVDDDKVIDMGNICPTLKDALANGMLNSIAERVSRHEDWENLADVTLLPVIPNPDKIVCVGLNYKSHIEETGRSDSDYPVLFTRWADTQIGSGEPMICPVNSSAYDYEGELAVIMGAEARHVKERDALGYIAGYSCYNDGSIRDWQRHTHQFTPGKNFPRTGGFGPWMVTTDEIPDPSSLRLQTRLNG
ncbi:MAG: fumarylacetoacetate hydrolase family protein, partial [Rhodospirillaceae bacterium]|nr:fumarylacetoacetate hydrolase family protein [Rhodospirillaceae bacterium]